MEFRILGSVEAWHKGCAVDLGGPRQRVVLGALLLRANDIVPAGSLAQAAWETPPATPDSNVRTYISGLRRCLRKAGDDASRLATLPTGYRFTIGPGELDVQIFYDLADQGERALRTGRCDRAVECFERALALWHSQPFAGLPLGQPMDVERGRLEERRLAVVEQHVEAKIELGEQDSLISDLRQVVHEHPFRERCWAWLMLALYQSGRQAEALEAFHDARQTLVRHAGIDPGPELQHMQELILDNDTQLIPPQQPLYRSRLRTRGPAGRNDLPREVTYFTGRRDEVQQMLTLSPNPVTDGTATISVIDGMAGTGKTSLAVHVAHRLALRYPDAQLLVDLHGHSANEAPMEPAAALVTLLRAADVPAEDIPDGLDERAALWRARLANSHMVIVLDNAACESQIRPLLPGTPGCRVLVTSRRRLPGLEATQRMSIDVLPSHEAVTLFSRIVGDDRAAAELEATREVAKLCGHLPLAIRIAASRLVARPTWRIGDLLERLRSAQRRLLELNSRDRSVIAAFKLSYQNLTPSQRRMLRRLSRCTNDVTAPYAAAIADLDAAEAEAALENLLDEHLLEQKTPGRYQMHTLVRLFARHQANIEERASAPTAKG